MKGIYTLDIQTLGGGFKYFLFSSLPGEMIKFDYSNIFQMGWFNHQLETPPEKVNLDLTNIPLKHPKQDLLRRYYLDVYDRLVELYL